MVGDDSLHEAASAVDARSPDGNATDSLTSLPTISLLFMIVGGVRSLLLTTVALFTVSGGRVTWLIGWLAFLILPGVIAAVLRYATFRYRLGDEELHLREGVLERNERHIPYARIQNVDLVQNPVHRWLDVATVRLETASGGKPEASISVLPLATVEALRARVFQGRHQATGVAEGAGDAAAGRGIDPAAAVHDRPLVAVPAKELILLGLLSNKGMLVVAAGLGLMQQLGVFDSPERIGIWLEPWIRSGFDEFDPAAWSAFEVGALVALLFVVFVFGTRLLSAGWMLFTLWNFRLLRRGDDLRTAYGLLTRVTATVPRGRVQLLSFRESLLQSVLGRASLQVETAGGGQAQGGHEQGPGASRLWLAPMLARSALPDLIAEVWPHLDIERLDWRPISVRATRRVVRLGLVATSLITVGACAAAGVWGLLALTLVPLVWWRAVRLTRRAGWTITDEAVFYRSGPWGRSTSVVPFSKVQSVLVHQSPFDRRWGMATVDVDTAGARAGSHRVEIPYLDVVNAHALARLLAREASRRSFRW